MSYLYRCIFSLVIAIALFYFSPLAQAQTLFEMGVNRLIDSNYQAAITNFTRAIALREDVAEAYLNRCNARIELADYRRAITDCTTAINLANNSIEPLLSRSIAYYRQGDYQAAIIIAP